MKHIDEDMVSIIICNVYEHDKEPNNYSLDYYKNLRYNILNKGYLSNITKSYIEKCDEFLGIYDPRAVRKNLEKISFL